MRVLLQKIMFFVVFNLGLTLGVVVWLAPAILEDLLLKMTLVLLLLVGFVDAMLRPITEQREASRRCSVVMLARFVIGPFLIVLEFYENQVFISQFVGWWNHPAVAILGMTLLMVGGGILWWSRYHLGRLGSGRIVIEKDHQLITTGVYRVVRHPMYFAGLLGALGVGIAFGSILVTAIGVVIDLVSYGYRIATEEQLLKQEFGDAYEEYAERTKRLIPFVY